MKIRRATFDDLEQLTIIFDNYRVFYEQESDLERARAFLSQHFTNQSSVIFLAMNDMGKCIGFTQLYPSFSSVATAKLWILNDLFVSTEARKQGVARQLMEAARDFAKADGAIRLVLETAANNQPAQKLYEELGYKLETGFFHYGLEL